MNGVMYSVQSYHCHNIRKGKKIYELRKYRPSIEPPFIGYIYETKGVQRFILDGIKNKFIGTGKVIGEFVCDRIDTIDIPYPAYFSQVKNKEILERDTCLTLMQMHNYLKDKTGYLIHITDLKIYDELKDIREFYSVKKYVKCENKSIFQMCKLTNEQKLCVQVCCNRKRKIITRPPQSWCYVEVLQ